MGIGLSGGFEELSLQISVGNSFLVRFIKFAALSSEF